jgi:hypothetical protein
MIETITPAVCGGRNQYRLAFAAFTLGALAAAALLGAALGLAGSVFGVRDAVIAVAVLAALAAVREAGLLRLPLPQLRLQVPESWHHELPLSVWATGYGAGLGAGVFTYQPVATFWIACASALALGRPLPAAACFLLYGAGRAFMVIVPQRCFREATVAVERLARRRSALRRANAIALAMCAALLAASPASGAGLLSLGVGNQLDPSVSNGVLAYTQRDAAGRRVVVRVSAAETYSFSGARTPSLDGGLVAYGDAAGVRVVEWASGSERARLPGNVSRPALDWPWLAYRVDNADGTSEIRLRNLQGNETRSLTKFGSRVDLGRPALAAGRVAWQVVSERASRIVLYTIATRARISVAKSRVALVAHPALTSSRILWVEHRSGVSRIKRRRIASTRAYTLVGLSSRSASMWTTALGGGSVYYTRWAVATGAAKLYKFTP